MATPIKIPDVPLNVPPLDANGNWTVQWIMFFQRLADAVKQLQP
jgi:hypothetical protein